MTSDSPACNRSPDLPATEDRAVRNHGWISTCMEDSKAIEANRRLDFTLVRDASRSAVVTIRDKPFDAWSPAETSLTGQTFTARDNVLMSGADRGLIRLKSTCA